MPDLNPIFEQVFASFGQSGIAPFLTPVENQITYKLVTGASNFDPYRGSAGGRAYSDDHFHIYTADQTKICSGEVVGTAPVPPGSLVGEYVLSGRFIDYDKITTPGFQDQWRACSGEQRHSFSQEFTSYLVNRGAIPADVAGSVWTSITGEALGILGRCYAITGAINQNITCRCSYEYGP